MKITISAYEGTPNFQSFSAELDDDCNLSDFIDSLESLIRCFYSNKIVIDCHMEDEEKSE